MKCKITTLLLAMFISISSFAGRHYGGGHHTSSHGGHYTGGHGSSHKGGHYNYNGSHNYGSHKR